MHYDLNNLFQIMVEVFTMVSIKGTVFGNVTPCSLLNGYQSFDPNAPISHSETGTNRFL